jgi:hypothetical protein
LNILELGWEVGGLNLFNKKITVFQSVEIWLAAMINLP